MRPDPLIWQLFCVFIPVLEASLSSSFGCVLLSGPSLARLLSVLEVGFSAQRGRNAVTEV